MKTLRPFCILITIELSTYNAVGEGLETAQHHDNILQENEKAAERAYSNIQAIEQEKPHDAAVALKKLLRDHAETSFVKKNIEEIKRIQASVIINSLTECAQIDHETSILTDPFRGFEMSFPKGWTAIPVVKVAPWMFGNISQNPTTEQHQPRFVIVSPYSNDITFSIYLSDNSTTIDAASELYLKTFKRKENLPLQEIKINEKRFRVSTGSDPRFYLYFSDEQKKSFCFLLEWKGHSNTATEIIEAFMNRVLNTFKINKAVNPQSEGIIDVLQIPPENLPGWKVHDTPYLKFLHTTDDDFVKQLGINLEIMRELYKQILSSKNDLGNSQSVPKGTVRLFDDAFQRDAFIKAPNGVGALYVPMTKQVVAYRERGRLVGSGKQVAVPDHIREATFNLLYHEVFHLYADIYFASTKRNSRLPPWLNEGLGEYFFGTLIDEKSERVVEISKNFFRYPVIRNLIENNEFIPFNKFFYFTRKQYYANPIISYAQGWSICYFILENKEDGKDKYRKFLHILFDELPSSSNWMKCLDESLKKADINLADMEKDWKNYFQR